MKLTREQGRSGNFHLALHPRKHAGWREVSCQLSVLLPSPEWRPPAYTRRLWAPKQKFLNLLRHGAHSVSRYHKCFRFPLFLIIKQRWFSIRNFIESSLPHSEECAGSQLRHPHILEPFLLRFSWWFTLVSHPSNKALYFTHEDWCLGIWHSELVAYLSGPIKLCLCTFIHQTNITCFRG